jgi:5,10-methylenetetrahydromethanopterin reductase
VTSRPALSCVFPPGPRVVEYARDAERLGYHRIWLYDSPALYGDVWISLARIADATERIGLGTGVAIPSLRHPMVTASAIADIERSAPGRLVVAVGTGFTGRLAMGARPMRWADLVAYVDQARRLLAGEVVTVQGGRCQMLHAQGWAPPRPIDTPVLVAPAGPKGYAAARDLGVPGVVVPALPRPQDRDPGWEICGLLVSGTVVRPGEDHTSRRLTDAIGPHYATAYHGIWEFAPAMLADLPGGADWLARIEAEREPGERHLAVHEGHLTVVTPRDLPLLTQAGERILQTGWTGDAGAVRARFDEAGAAGVTEVLYMAAGPDIPGELAAMADARA